MIILIIRAQFENFNLGKIFYLNLLKKAFLMSIIEVVKYNGKQL